MVLEAAIGRHIHACRIAAAGVAVAGIARQLRCIAGGTCEHVANRRRTEHLGHRAAQQQVFNRTPFQRELGVVGAAEGAVLGVAIANGQVQGMHERHILEDRHEQFRIRFLDVVTTLQGRRALATENTGAGVAVEDQRGIDIGVRIFGAVVGTDCELHAAARQIEQRTVQVEALDRFNGERIADAWRRRLLQLGNRVGVEQVERVERRATADRMTRRAAGNDTRVRIQERWTGTLVQHADIRQAKSQRT